MSGPGGPDEAGLALVWCPCESRGEASRIASVLVSERLVACANILGPMLSIYSWQGALAESEEHGLLCKTSLANREATMARIEQLHGYDTPVVVGWIGAEATPGTMAWLEAALAKG